MSHGQPVVCWPLGPAHITAGTSWLTMGREPSDPKPLRLRGADELGRLLEFLPVIETDSDACLSLAGTQLTFTWSGNSVTLWDVTAQKGYSIGRCTLADLEAWLAFVCPRQSARKPPDDGGLGQFAVRRAAGAVLVVFEPGGDFEQSAELSPAKARELVTRLVEMASARHSGTLDLFTVGDGLSELSFVTRGDAPCGISLVRAGVVSNCLFATKSVVARLALAMEDALAAVTAPDGAPDADKNYLD